MDLIVSESKKRGEMELQHFSHHHPLFFIQDQSVTDKAAQCFGCEELIDGPSYGCNDCKYYLHKRCAELECTPHLNHPFHPQHLLTLLPKSPYEYSWLCNFCRRLSSGFVYHCDSCQFGLHINCALLQSSIAPNFPSPLHQHPLFFIQDHNEEVNCDCSGCMKPLSGPIYYCLDSYLSDKCYFPDKCFFILHKQCAELPLEINHPYDRRKHPLTLLPKPPTHLHNCSCYLCKIQWKGFIYSCSFCKIELTLEDVSAPPTIKNASHEHPWTLLSRQRSFICDFCGTTGDRTPYICAICDLLVHKNCISLPRSILITRHHHVISHSYSLPQQDELCRICYEEVDTRYGSYHCSASDCGYISHVHCATDKAVWDGNSVPEDYDERSMEVLDESMNLITNIVEQMSFGEKTVAVEIKHAYHDHNLRLTFSGEMNDDGQCDGCMRPISTPFYSCEQCKLFLHKKCAELPRKKRHPFHKHLLTLTNSSTVGIKACGAPCSACHRLHHGFRYKCNDRDCICFECDIRCILLSDTLEHPSHEHLLFLIHNFSAKCSACRRNGNPWDMAYRCTKRCDFTLDLQCATLPLTTWYKYERHPLTLTCTDDSDPSQHYCDLCEHERDPNDWFYYCAECDNSLHSICALGDIPFLKIGSNIDKLPFHSHPHPFTIVKNIWDCPPCKFCGEVCNGQALQCKESECNFSIHWFCPAIFPRFSNSNE